MVLQWLRVGLDLVLSDQPHPFCLYKSGLKHQMESTPGCEVCIYTRQAVYTLDEPVTPHM